MRLKKTPHRGKGVADWKAGLAESDSKHLGRCIQPGQGWQSLTIWATPLSLSLHIPSADQYNTGVTASLRKLLINHPTEALFSLNSDTLPEGPPFSPLSTP